MASSQFFGHGGQQLFFKAFRFLMEPAGGEKQGRSPKPFGLLGEKALVQPFKFPGSPYEYKVVPLQECPTPERMQLCDTPELAADYWRLHIAGNPYFDPERECFTVLLLNTRRRVKGHQLVSIGTLDTILVHLSPGGCQVKLARC